MNCPLCEREVRGEFIVEHLCDYHSQKEVAEALSSYYKEDTL